MGRPVAGALEPVIDVPDVLARTVRRTWPVEGPGRVAGLDALVGGLAAEWGLKPGTPYPLSVHWVAPVRCADGTAAVPEVGVHHGVPLAVAHRLEADL